MSCEKNCQARNTYCRIFSTRRTMNKAEIEKHTDDKIVIIPQGDLPSCTICTIERPKQIDCDVYSSTGLDMIDIGWTMTVGTGASTINRQRTDRIDGRSQINHLLQS